LKKIVTIVLLLIIGFGLNVTNPSKNEFIDFASAQIKKKYPDLDFNAKLNGSGLEKMIAGFGNMIITNFLNEATTRKDYVMFSIYELDMKMARDFGVEAKNMKILGIAGNFFPLTKE
jgi:biotin-(acetyl-CoA carboxylase) ligase